MYDKLVFFDEVVSESTFLDVKEFCFSSGFTLDDFCNIALSLFGEKKVILCNPASPLSSSAASSSEKSLKP